MQKTIKTTNFTMTPEAESFLDEKMRSIEKLLPRASADDEVRCDIELEKEVAQNHGRIWRAEMNLFVHGKVYRATARAEDINGAIDEARNEMQKRLRRNKKKRFSALRRGGARLKELLRFGGRREDAS